VFDDSRRRRDGVHESVDKRTNRAAQLCRHADRRRSFVPPLSESGLYGPHVGRKRRRRCTSSIIRITGMSSADRKLAVSIVLALLGLMALIAWRTEGSGRLIALFALRCSLR
jgi:hypothetical protein